MNKIRSEIEDRNKKNKPVHENSQYEQTVESSEAARDAYHEVVRDYTTAVTDNLETHKGESEVIDYRKNKRNKRREMESEEARLLKVFRKKCERREKREERRRERIEHLKRLIAEIPSDPEESQDEEQKRIEEEIREVEARFNKREETKKVFRVTEKVYDGDGREVAIVKAIATMNVQINRTRINFNRQGILVSTIMKDSKAKSKTQLLGDINVEEMINFQLEIQELPDEEPPEESTLERSEPRSMEIAVPVAETRIRQTNVSMEMDQASGTNFPEITSHPCPVEVREEVVRTSEKSPETTQEIPLPEARQPRRRVRTYSRKRLPSSDSTGETRRR